MSSSYHTPSHGQYNLDAHSYDRAFSRGIIYRSLKVFPARYRTLIGGTAIVAASAIIYKFIRPNPNNKPLKTMTKEWEEAESAYSQAQNQNPIYKYKQEKTH